MNETPPPTNNLDDGEEPQETAQKIEYSSPGHFSIKDALEAMEAKKDYYLIEFELSTELTDPETKITTEVSERFDVRVTSIERTTGYLDSAEMREIMGTPDEGVAETPEAKKVYLTALMISDKGRHDLGLITGQVEYQGTQFVNFHIVNFAKDEAQAYRKARYVPNLMKEAIIQLILQKKFDIFYSSMIMTKKGDLLYLNMSNDGRVDVEEDYYYDGEKRWKVTRKTTRLNQT